MESANLRHQYQLQEQFVGSSSLPGVGSNNAWNPNLILNGGLNVSNSRDLRQNGDDIVVPPLNTSMIQDLGINWVSNTANFTNHSAHELQLAKIKELSDYPCPKFFGTFNGALSNLQEFHLPSTSYIKHEQQDLVHDLSEKLLLKTLSSGWQFNGLQLSAGDYSNSFGGVATSSRGNFSQIFPTTNISNLNPSASLSISSSLGMNLHALDLLNSTKFGGCFSQPSNDNLGLYKENRCFGLDHLQESNPCWTTSSTNKISSYMNGVTQTKRSSSTLEPKASHTAPKKPRLESRSSFPPFKVRKEKLGDRIAALQQLVAPFGKTDTASVLNEAIGYIKFLQDQVQTLSLPYMKSSCNNTQRTIQGGSSEEEGEEEEEAKPDLRSRGLCLVPLSCTSYVTNDSLCVWPLPNFGGGT